MSIEIESKLEQTYKKESDKSRYTRDNANGIVTDHATGLMWQDNTVDSQMNWEKAIAYGENLSLGDYTDWRLPSIDELKTLINHNRVSSAIDPTFQNVASDSYWSSTAVASFPSNVWGVNFYYGFDDWDDKGGSFYVRCVRDFRNT